MEAGDAGKGTISDDHERERAESTSEKKERRERRKKGRGVIRVHVSRANRTGTTKSCCLL
jgi:hypothetical protein